MTPHPVPRSTPGWRPLGAGLCLLLALGGPALAEEEAPDEADEEAAEEASEEAESVPDAGWIDLSGASSPDRPSFDSALDTFVEDAQGHAGEEDARPEDFLPPESAALLGGGSSLAKPGLARIRGRFGIRPLLGAQILEGVGGGAVIGLQGSHQWWSLTERRVVPVGESQLRLSAPLAAKGWGLQLDSTAGLWAGPVGLMVGPSARAEAWHKDGVGLDPALALGPTARLGLQLGPVVLSGGASPLWTVLGDRPALDTGAPWDELALFGGVELDGRPFAWRLGAERRQTGQGALWTATLGLQLRLL